MTSGSRSSKGEEREGGRAPCSSLNQLLPEPSHLARPEALTLPRSQGWPLLGISLDLLFLAVFHYCLLIGWMTLAKWLTPTSLGAGCPMEQPHLLTRASGSF